ncbi:sugar phosphate isomerase/epimerase family protein [Phytoactinopolyspora limicola]|uniref:sugar phosphate isomerase/epimerase family protein n=1 Tax=Phytoactinopolyspora limicola TaxID=2715536 RepID=UPI00140C6243|nr:sugar phosphate isomerase/epimerase family protein [Phytoactinopolyspora limicola]
MRFAVFTVSTPEWDPTAAAKELVAAGYDGVEWRVAEPKASADGQPGFWVGNRCTWPVESVVDDAPRIKSVTEDAGLRMPALGTYLQPHQLADVERLMRVARALGVPQLRVSSGPYDPTTSVTVQWDQRRAEYAQVAELAAQYGVRANIEIHHKQLTPSPHAAAAFLAGLNPEHVGVIYDIGNMVWEGWTDYRLGLEALGPYLAHVQVKNGVSVTAATRADGTVEWKNAQRTLREGLADIPALMTALRQVGYDEWISVEDFSDLGPHTRTDRIADNLTYLKAALES